VIPVRRSEVAADAQGRSWQGVFGAAASQSVYWGFKRPDQHLE